MARVQQRIGRLENRALQASALALSTGLAAGCVESRSPLTEVATSFDASATTSSCYEVECTSDNESTSKVSDVLSSTSDTSSSDSNTSRTTTPPDASVASEGTSTTYIEITSGGAHAVDSNDLTGPDPGGDAGLGWCGEAGIAACIEPEPEPDAGLRCGNGILEREEGEECDDGNLATLDGCSDCLVTSGWRCDPGRPCFRLVEDQRCTNGCWAGDACIEASSGVGCACPTVTPDVCGEVYFRSFPLPDESRNCWGTDVAADGSTIVGTCFDVSSWEVFFPVVWRRGMPPARLAERGYGRTVSANGSAFVTAFLGTVTLHPSNAVISEKAFVDSPWGMNQDGSTVVGDAFIWNQIEGAVQLVSPDGETFGGTAKDIAEVDSPFGGRVVGAARDEHGAYWAAVWTMSGVASWLPKLEGATGAQAHAISADGSVIVGQVLVGGGSEAVRWTSNGVERLGPHGAYAVNSDGSLIAGHDSHGVWLYDDTSGLRRLNEILTDLGMDMSDWGSLSVSALSLDGRTIVGTGQYLGDDQTNFLPRAIAAYLP